MHLDFQCSFITWVTEEPMASHLAMGYTGATHCTLPPSAAEQPEGKWGVSMLRLILSPHFDFAKLLLTVQSQSWTVSCLTISSRKRSGCHVPPPGGSLPLPGWSTSEVACISPYGSSTTISVLTTQYRLDTEFLYGFSAIWWTVAPSFRGSSPMILHVPIYWRVAISLSTWVLYYCVTWKYLGLSLFLKQPSSGDWTRLCGFFSPSLSTILIILEMVCGLTQIPEFSIFHANYGHLVTASCTYLHLDNISKKILPWGKNISFSLNSQWLGGTSSVSYVCDYILRVIDWVLTWMSSGRRHESIILFSLWICGASVSMVEVLWCFDDVSSLGSTDALPASFIFLCFVSFDVSYRRWSVIFGRLQGDLPKWLHKSSYGNHTRECLQGKETYKVYTFFIICLST